MRNVSEYRNDHLSSMAAHTFRFLPETSSFRSNILSSPLTRLKSWILSQTVSGARLFFFSQLSLKDLQESARDSYPSMLLSLQPSACPSLHPWTIWSSSSIFKTLHPINSLSVLWTRPNHLSLVSLPKPEFF